MRHKALLLIDLLTIVVSPFAIWGLLVIIGDVGKANLSGILPWLRAFRWVAYCAAVLLLFIGIADERLWRLGGFASAAVCASTGLGFVERWVKRRYAPELLASNSPTIIL